MKSCKIIFLTIFCLLLIFPFISQADESKANFYVSPAGDDSNPGTMEKPFKTVMRAREAVRSIKWKQMSGEVKDITVMLRGGKYYLANPIVFTEHDSSNYGYKITYRNYPGEKPVLIGGVPIKGWEKFKNKIYKVHVPLLKEGGIEFYQLFENGKPAALAQSPNEGWFRMVDANNKSFHYFPDDFDATNFDLKDLRIQLIEFGAYFSSFKRVEKVDVRDHLIEFTTRPQYPFGMFGPHPKGMCYIIQNAMELLDAPGEFYVDTDDGYLYYWPMCKNIEESEIIIPMVESAILFNAYTWQYPVHDIVIDGLQFEISRTADVWRNGWISDGENGHLTNPDEIEPGMGKVEILNETDRFSQYHSHHWGLIRLTNAEQITIRNCRILNAGMNAVSMSPAAARNIVEGCEIANPGMNGVYLKGQPAIYNTDDKRDTLNINNRNKIHNNYIHHCGRLYLQGSGVRVINSSDNIISNNRLSDIARSGVMLVSQWNVPRKLTTLNKNLVKNNEFYRCSSGTWDGGALFTGCASLNHTIENNLFADVWAWRIATWPHPHARIGDNTMIDFDPGICDDTIIKNNLFYGVDCHKMEFGRPDESIFYNNYVEDKYKYPEEAKYIPSRHFFLDQSLTFRPNWVNRDIIGLTKDFKFTVPVEVTRPLTLPIESDFENTSSPLYLYRYNDGLSQDIMTTQNVHSGKTALTIDKDVCVFRYRHPNSISAKVTVWMYDDASKKEAEAFVFVRDGDASIYPFYMNMEKQKAHRGAKTPDIKAGWFSSENESFAAIGVYGKESEDKYVICVDGRTKVTDIERKTGWHKIAFELDENVGGKISFDDKEAASIPEIKKFNMVDLGDNEFASDSRGICFDSFSIE